MKKMKKIVSLILAAVMVMAMTVVAFAEGDTSGTTTKPGAITVDNAKDNVQYTAYKIFDLKYTTDKSSYSYTITDDSAWKDEIREYARTTGKGLSVSSTASSSGTYDVTITKGTFSAADFANFLKSKVTGKTGNPLRYNTETGKIEVTGLELGYYFVNSSEENALCNLTTTDPTATIHDKNDVPFAKDADKTSVDVGQNINYALTGKVQNTTGFGEYVYKVTDTMSAGLTFNKNVQVYYVDNGVEQALSTQYYDVFYEGNTDKDGKVVADNSFVLYVDMIKLNQDSTKEGATENYINRVLKIRYSAKVNKDAVATISNNKAQLNYSNDPTDGSKTTPTDEIVKNAYSAKIVIDKYEEGTESKKLADAEFVLKKKNPQKTDEYLYYKAEKDQNGLVSVSWTKNINEATKVLTDNTGAATFEGLADGTYYLQETKAPEGYNMLTIDTEVKIDGSNAEADKQESMKALSATAKIANNKGTLLPSTGGIGTTIFYVLGGILVLGAAVVLVTKRRMNEK